MTATASALQACLEKEAQLVSEFLTILQDEAQVLADGATESALADTTERKNTAADTLAKVASERNALLADLGLEIDGPGLKAAVDAHPELAVARQTLIDLTEQASALNESNGRIIDVFLDHNQRTLETLRRLTGVGDIYDASGRKRPGSPGSGRNIKAG